jgi:hypothetical protein
MNFSRVFITVFGIICACNAAAQDSQGALMRCGASVGSSYFFHDPLYDPKGPNWQDDGISKGKIILVKLGDEWDIQFDDANGAYGYREDGATVMILGQADGKMTVGAFHPNYTDIYTFNVADSEVVWSSHKIGTAVTKVAIYRADCQ